MRTIVAAAILALTAAGCAAAGAIAEQPVAVRNSVQSGPVAVTVTRDGDAWTVDYLLNASASAWAFQRSGLTSQGRQSWRLAQWRVLTPGVVLERQGDRDVLRMRDGSDLPRQIRIQMRPAATDLEFDYSPALVFSDGAVALYSEHFDLIPLSPQIPARMTPAELEAAGAPREAAEVTWLDTAGPVLLEGRRQNTPVTRQPRTYVLFGEARRREGARMTTVIDPALPLWIGDELSAFAPRVADFYLDRLGPGQTDRPTVMVSWSGPTSGTTSMNGSVLPGLLIMSFDGAGIVQPTDEMRTVSRWFIGHESAHFWLGQAVRYEFARDAWITEGGADLMAVRALAALEPGYDARAELQKEVDDCVRLAANGPVAQAGERGEHRAFYACGAVWAMAAEGAVRQRSGGDWFDFLKPLLDANRRDGVLTREEWLSALTRASRDPSLRIGIERMLDVGGNPTSEIARLFDRTGVAYRMAGGRIVLG